MKDQLLEKILNFNSLELSDITPNYIKHLKEQKISPCLLTNTQFTEKFIELNKNLDNLQKKRLQHFIKSNNIVPNEKINICSKNILINLNDPNKIDTKKSLFDKDVIPEHFIFSKLNESVDFVYTLTLNLENIDVSSWKDSSKSKILIDNINKLPMTLLNTFTQTLFDLSSQTNNLLISNTLDLKNIESSFMSRRYMSLYSDSD